MSDIPESTTASTDTKPQRGPLPSIERRVLGVLVEKAKTVPDSYPMSLNAIVTGSNQKNNRSPQMNLDEVQVDDALTKLRGIGAVALVQGSGRVDKYRHLLHDWLSVNSMELAVIAELLLRGTQMVGELRSRAGRMESIADQATLQTILKSLEQKGFVTMLTPPGRGQIVTHTFWLPQEADKVNREASRLTAAFPTANTASISASSSASNNTEYEDLRREIQMLQERIDQMEQTLTKLREDLGG